jgi:biofilm protein TabA
MILDDLSHSALYESLHPGFKAAFKSLRRSDLRSLPPGKHDIDGNRLFLIIGKDEGRTREGAKLEAHRRYIDIQLVLEGDEEMGWRPVEECQHSVEPFSEERDLVLFTDQPTAWFSVPPGKFAIFMPADAHAPLAGKGLLHKAVAKVAVNW